MAMSDGPPPVTVLLQAWARGDRAALQQLTPLIYGELRRLAGGHLRRERRGHTFSATDLVAEAFLRLAGGEHPAYEHRLQFFAVAARHMRRILVDHARRRITNKRSAGEVHVTLDVALIPEDRPEALIALDDALEALTVADERKAKVVELRYFAGMELKEIASTLGVHENTVARDLRLAEAWLHREMTAGS